MQKIYSRINWENDPSTNTPLNESNLNKMDYALDIIDKRVVNLSGYEERANESETNAGISENNAKISEENAKQSELNSKISETNTKHSETEAKISETNAKNSETLSKSYAVGGTNTRNGEETDNSKYYSQKSETYMKNAQVSSREALSSYGKAEMCANQAKQSENNAKQSEINAKNYYNLTSTLNEKVTQTKADVQRLANQVTSDKEEVDETIKNSLLENSEEILETIKSYFERAEALYSSMYFDCDGETPYLRTVTPIVIDGENPIQRSINIGIDFDGGTPLSRQLAS